MERETDGELARLVPVGRCPEMSDVCVHLVVAVGDARVSSLQAATLLVSLQKTKNTFNATELLMWPRGLTF